MSRAKTNIEFLAQLQSINSDIIPNEQYINNHTPLLCSCAKCGHYWNARPNSLLRGYGCPNCAGNTRKSNAEFVRELMAINPNVESLEEYKSSKIPILCRCKKCNHEWKLTPNNALSKGHKCPYCSHQESGRKRRKTNDCFVNELYSVNPNIQPLDSYTTSQKKIKCRCLICGFVWSATPNNLLDKASRCPECSHSATSAIEQIILHSFSMVLGDNAVLSRDKSAIGKELDIYLPQERLAIEFGAWFWHKKRIQRDNEKQRLCLEKGIHLISILEDCPSFISEDLIGDYRLFQKELSNEADYRTVKDIIRSIFAENNLDFSDVDNYWNSIVCEANLQTQRRSDDEFQRKLHNILPSVMPLEKYTKSTVKVLCRCDVCGNEWSSLPTSLLSGHGCQNCARKAVGKKKTISNDEFLTRLSQVNNGVIPLETYTHGSISIRCQCKKCGYMWCAKPKSLLFGNGCPKCAKKIVAQKVSKPIRCVETGVCYESISDARRKTGIDGVHKCAKGKQKTAGGFHWEYNDENEQIK